MTLELLRARFRFRAAGAIRFPPGLPGNILRGAFGTIFRRLACLPECRDAFTRRHAPGCAYARIFEPHAAPGQGPSGLADQPRPFVFRASHLAGCAFQAGQPFFFDLHLFDCKSLEGRESPLTCFVECFAELAREGLGPGRGRAELVAVESEPIRLDLSRATARVARAAVRFVTPTELKSQEQVARTPEFGLLFSRLRDRLSTLRALYGPGPLELDFRATGERAAAVRLVRSDLRWIGLDRRSSRTGQVHPIGGFTGEAEYAGELGEFLPYLEAGQWTGVGRQTVWGKGEIHVEATGAGGEA